MTDFQGIKDKKTGIVYFGKSANVAPAILEAAMTQQGVIFSVIKQSNGDSLFSDPHDPSHGVMEEITKFLDSRAQYKELGLAHKRGILLYGPPGTGKTATTSLLCKLFMEKTGGLVVHNGTNCLNFIHSVMRGVKDHDRDVPLMVVFDDITQVTEGLLQILDGQVQFDNVVYVFTTNYYNKLPPALKRPSRTDLHVHIADISDESARNYCINKFKDDSYKEIKSNLAKLKIKPTYAMLKEIMLLKKIYGNSTEQACRRVANCGTMTDDLENTQTGSGFRKMGFAASISPPAEVWDPVVEITEESPDNNNNKG